MTSFDVDAYYVEQDARVNQPDETVDQFRERLSAFNRRYVVFHRGTRCTPKISRRQGFNYASRIPEARSLSSISTLHEEVGSLSINDNDHEDAGNNLKRKASLQPLESPGKRPNIASASVKKEDILCGDVPPEINQLPGRSLQNLQPPDKPTSDMEEMDSFTVLTSDPPNASTTEFGKSKSIPTTLSQSPRGNKYLQDHGSMPQPSPEPPTADFSPYVVFHRYKLHVLNLGPGSRLFRGA